MNTQPLTPQSAGITGPMNINAVITHLIEMTPSQRKQFAQVHMDDPMMLSAAKFVDNQVNKQAASLAAQQTGAAPPPVNQQAVAQMAGSILPEDTGIAQLPVENMPSEYAAGGIVAFAEGDVVRGMPVSAQTAAMYREAGQTGTSLGTGIRESLQAAGASLTDAGTNYLKAKIERNEPLTGVEKEQAKRAGLTVPVAVSNRGVPALLNKDAPAYTGPSVPPAKAKDDKVKRNPDNYKPEKTPLEAASKEEKEINQRGGDRVENAAPSASATSASFKESSYSPKSKSSLEEVFKRSMDSQGPVVDPYAAQRAEAGESRQAIARRALEGVKERESGIEALLSKKEERVAEREERLKGQEGINLNMSLINAGLSMMQSTGKGLAGIAEGAQKGVSQYSEGMRLSEAARQKIEDARDAHDDLRFNLKNMSSKEKQAAENSIEEAKIVTTLEAISGLEKAYGISHNKAVALFGAEITERTAESNREYQAFEAAEGRKFTGSQTDKQIAAAAKEGALDRSSRAGQAAASLAMQEKLAKLPGQYQQLYTALGKGDIVKGYEIAMIGRNEGALDKVKLAKSEEYLKDPMNNPNFNKKADSELWSLHTNFVKSSLMPSVPSVNIPQTNSALINRP